MSRLIALINSFLDPLAVVIVPFLFLSAYLIPNILILQDVSRSRLSIFFVHISLVSANAYFIH